MARGKRKNGGGFSGVSKFLLESMRSEASDSSTQGNAVSASPPQKVSDHGDDKTLSKMRQASLPDSKFTQKTLSEKYDASGLVSHCSRIEDVPEHLRKYFAQRYRLFSLYSTPPGCLLDEEGWYSVTPESVADQIAERCRCGTILDAFCGVGGNAIAFAKTCERVIALDISPVRLALARHNAQIYGVADRIEFILCDYRAFVNSSFPHNRARQRKIDVVFLSPPWGGPSYLDADEQDSHGITSHSSYSLSFVQPVHGAELFDLARRVTQNVAYYLPRNTRLEDVSLLLVDEEKRIGNKTSSAIQEKTNEKIEVEEEWMGNKLKALTCYFGGLVKGQETMF